jgi:hypothetical protein
VALYPLVWLCARDGALIYTGYLLYLGIPTFLNINKEEGLSFSSSTLAIGVLVLEVLLALTVILGVTDIVSSDLLHCWVMPAMQLLSRFFAGGDKAGRYDAKPAVLFIPNGVRHYVHE